MSNSSILGGPAAPRPAPGKDVDALGPSDTSDSGSDVQGARSMPTAPDSPDEWGAIVPATDNDSDAQGTGERGAAGADEAVRDGDDILPDRVIEGDPDSDLVEDGGSVGVDDLPDDDAEDDDAPPDGDGDAAGRRGPAR
ncbi:MAG: hypothetical protein M3O01_06600 [Pseudomonadota bacterium]|nr:hypothetical protein [Pseudomonadota bacterium]